MGTWIYHVSATTQYFGSKARQRLLVGGPFDAEHDEGDMKTERVSVLCVLGTTENYAPSVFYKHTMRKMAEEACANS